jgi:hypothetical protein
MGKRVEDQQKFEEIEILLSHQNNLFEIITSYFYSIIMYDYWYRIFGCPLLIECKEYSIERGMLMDFCTNCGKKLYESSGFCTNCGSRVAKDNKNMPSTPKTRMEKKKVHSNNKRLMAVVGLIIALVIVISVTSLMVRGFNKPEPNENIAATKTLDQSKDKDVENKSGSSHDNHSPEEKRNESTNLSSSDHILPDSDKRVLSEEDIANLSKGQLRLARNEIYARHGYVFKSADLQKYFSSKSWYNADPSYDGSLNEVEKENVKLLKAREDRL